MNNHLLAFLLYIFPFLKYYLLAVPKVPKSKPDLNSSGAGIDRFEPGSNLNLIPTKPTKLSTLLIEKENSISFNVGNDLKIYNNNILKSYSRGIGYGILAFNLSGSFNMGLMIRSALLSGCSNFYYTGKKDYDKRSTVGAHNYLNIQFMKDLCKPVKDIKEKPVYNYDKIVEFINDPTPSRGGYIPVFIELGGKCYHDFNYGSLDKQPLFIFGNERFGIPSSLINKFENPIVLSIPQHGVLRSYNVACAMSIITSHYYCQVINNNKFV